jgi:hypothetical protein
MRRTAAGLPVLGLVLAVSALHGGNAQAQTRPAPERYFYFGHDYGSQALFNPWWVFLNRSFDVLQDHVADRNIFRLEYRHNAANVLRNLADPFPAIRDRGWETFLKQEIIPLDFTEHGARWMPNYGLHLIGGGMTYSALREWYEDHQVPWPRVWSAATVLASALVNETIENKNVRGYNTDAIADIYVFDIGGIILFSFDAVNRLFSRHMIMSDWSLQPSFTLPRGELHNHGNYFAIKWPLPFYPPLRLFTYFGEATTGGLSVKLNGEYSVSFAAGGAATRILNQATNRVENVVTFEPTGLLFLDRNESLLASLQVSDVPDYFIHLNVYPHALSPQGPRVGFWTVMDKQARVSLGVTFALLGFGPGISSIGRGY